MNIPQLTTKQIVSRLKVSQVFDSITGCEQKTQGISANSKEASAENIFVCKGEHFKPAYLEEALQKGVRLFVTDQKNAAATAKVAQKIAPDATHVIVTNIRRALVVLSQLAYGDPQEHLSLVGITGTKGKSTTAYMLHQLLQESSTSAIARIGTHEIFDGRFTYASANTTPEPPELYKAFARAVENDVTLVVMEVSSQALKYDRTYGLFFDVAVVLNISPDHISPAEHPTFEDYIQSKARILKQSYAKVLSADAVAKYPQLSRGFVPLSVTMFGIGAGPDVSATSLLDNGLSSTFRLKTPEYKPQTITLNLPGRFNVENYLAAVACLINLGFPEESFDYMLQDMTSNLHIPGRLEISTTRDEHITVVVDYAHNKASFEAFFEAMKSAYPNHRVISVFGACGDKALNRLEDLPQVASQHSDVMIITADEPGVRTAKAVVDEMAEHVPSQSCGQVELIYSREEARTRAFDLAKQSQEPTLVCFLGKGSENTMEVEGKTVSIAPDTQVAKQLVEVYDMER